MRMLSDRPQCRFGWAPTALFVDHGAPPEPVEAEARRLLVRLVAGQKMRKDQAGGRASP